MVTLKKLCRHLDDFLESGGYTDYCPNGLQVEGISEVQKVAVAVSVSLAAIEQAVAAGAQVLLVHHGLFWKGDPYPIVGVKYRKLQLLIENGISLIAYHLPLDAHQTCGNNWKVAMDLGWNELLPFGIYNDTPIGVRGTFPEKNRDDLIKKLEDYYQHPVHAACGGKERVASCAIISGGAYQQIDQAIEAGVDCFVTGSFEERVWHIAHEEKMNFLAFGHSATERIGVQALAQHLQETFDVETTFIDIANPF